MKKLLLISVIISLSFSRAFSQINLVPNFSFEEYYYACPVYPGDFLPLNWNAYKSPDYFNACDDSLFYVSVPYNAAGYQYANTGFAYSGLYARASTNTFTNYREIIGCKLIDTLIIGTKYYVSFYASLAEYSNCASNKLGALFTTTPVDFNVWPIPLTNFSQIYTQSVMTDSVNWVIVTGEFYADSSYTYLYIGNLYDNLHTDSILFDTTTYILFNTCPDSLCCAYYYIDDVCVSTDSLTCNPLVSINDINKLNNINIFPNPVADIINVNVNNPQIKLIYYNLFDIYGRTVKQGNIENNGNINISDYKEGIYVLQIKINNITINKKIIIYKP